MLILEIFPGLSIVFLSGFFGVLMLKKSGLIFKSPMATESRMRDLIMARQQRVYDIVLHMQCHFLSGIHVIHPKLKTPQLVQLMNIVSNLIFHCNHCDANTAFIVSSGPSGLLNAKFTFKGTSPTNHFCTDS